MIRHIIIGTALTLALGSCTSGHLTVPSVKYQCLRTDYAQPASIPKSANIAIEYFFNQDGKMQPVVYNLTSEIMMIDQTQSFVIMPDGHSVSYYDPNVYTSTTGEFSSTTSGSTFNLGAVAGFMGLSGSLGTLMNGISLSSHETKGIMRQNSVSVSDQPMVRIGPKGSIAMSKAYGIEGIGRNGTSQPTIIDVSAKSSPIQFSVCVTYSLDNGITFEKLVTHFYVSSNIIARVDNRKVSEAFRYIYDKKPDALIENLYMFIINNNILHNSKDPIDNEEFVRHTDVYDNYIRGSLIDFQ